MNTNHAIQSDYLEIISKWVGVPASRKIEFPIEDFPPFSRIQVDLTDLTRDTCPFLFWRFIYEKMSISERTDYIDYIMGHEQHPFEEHEYFKVILNTPTEKVNALVYAIINNRDRRVA